VAPPDLTRLRAKISSEFSSPVIRLKEAIWLAAMPNFR
jgi:hypothetical protein